MTAKPKAKRPRELPVFRQYHELLVWTFERSAGWPKRLRPTLTHQLLERLLQIQRELLALRYDAQRQARFRAVNLDLETVRQLSRLLVDLRVLSERQYEYFHRELNAVGRQLGGWMKADARRVAQSAQP